MLGIFHFQNIRILRPNNYNLIIISKMLWSLFYLITAINISKICTCRKSHFAKWIWSLQRYWNKIWRPARSAWSRNNYDVSWDRNLWTAHSASRRRISFWNLSYLSESVQRSDSCSLARIVGFLCTDNGSRTSCRDGPRLRSSCSRIWLWLAIRNYNRCSWILTSLFKSGSILSLAVFTALKALSPEPWE